MARIKDFDVVFFNTAGELLSRATSIKLKKEISALSRKIDSTISDTFFVPERPERYSRFYFKQVKGRISSAELSYRHKAIPLSRYPVKQYRITVGKKILACPSSSNAWAR